jgi:hypothetical protein
MSNRLLWLSILLGSAVAVACGATCVAAEVLLFVSPQGDDRASSEAAAPLATPQAALDRLPAIAEKSPEARVRVVLAAGTYRIDSPLVIERKHVPAAGSLTVASAPGQSATISGGRPITGWKVATDGIWSAPLPASLAGQGSFRELFIGGQRRPRARHPNAGYLRIDQAFPDKRSGFTFRVGELPSAWTAGGELVFLHDWSTSRIPVREVDHESRRLTVAFPIGNRADHYKIDHFEPHPRYFVENHRAFLDAPAEWLVAEGVVHYLPLPSERPESVEAVAPLAETLLVVSGDDAAPIRNVHLERLAFQHCAWPLPAEGCAESQATAFEPRGEKLPPQRRFVPAALRFERAEECSFTGGRLAHLGGSGLEFGSRTRRCRIEDSVVEDVSGNGVNLGEDTSRQVGGRPWWQSAPDQAAAGHLVRHNRIERCGQQFFGAVAVWVGLGRGMQIEHNEIARHPYTGVSLGWMWNPTPTPAGENLVARNHIHHVMQVLSDGGGIYTLGRQPGTKLVENVIHDVPLNAGRAESNGMFLDEGSDQMEIAGNTIYGIDRSPLRFHKAEQMTVRGNQLVVPNAEMPPLRYNNTREATIRQIDNRVLLPTDFDAAKVPLPATGPRPPAGQ